MIRSLTLAVVVALVAAVLPCSAQSGRRIPTRRTAPPPSQPAPPAEQPSVPDTAPAPPSVPEGEKIPVSTAKYLANFSIRPDVCDAVVRACARELGESSIVRPMPSEDLTRKQAVDLAKGATTNYVLWFQFTIDGVDDEPMGAPRTYDPLLVANYVLYEPATAKIRTQGRLYFSSYDSNSRGGPSLGGVNRGARGLSPTETGLRVAAAVLDALEKDLLPRP